MKYLVKMIFSQLYTIFKSFIILIIPEALLVSNRLFKKFINVLRSVPQGILFITNVNL